MFQKLKRTLVAVSALTIALLSGWLGTASANTTNVSFACYDNTLAVNVSTANANHEVGVTCKSGAGIDYLNYQNERYTYVSVACPGAETYGTTAPAKVGDPYVFYCVTVSGQGDKAQFTRSGHNPTVTPAPGSGSSVDSGSPDPSAGGGDTTDGGDTDPTTTCSNDTANTCAVGDSAASEGNCSKIGNCDLIQKYVDPFINLLAAGVGLIVVVSVVIGGIQYGSSGGDPQKVTAAKARIRNAIIALVTFVLLYAMLNFLIPGGLL